ncbi:MAG: hypothetical protein IT425_01275 [Pirellulales bacterium]|nr:hypothetical protein [Pirellulales bacterium]
MQSPLRNLVSYSLAVVLIASSTGCKGLWGTSAGFFASPTPATATSSGSPTAAPTAPPAIGTLSQSQPPEAISASDASADLSGVMDKIQEVRSLDPAAEPRLFEELRKAPPNTWPLVAEQFRATLALHQQLAAKNSRAPLDAKQQEPGMLTKPDVTPLLGAIAARNTPIAASLPNAAHVAADPTERPSSTIGGLVDPHTISTSPELDRSPRQPIATASSQPVSLSANLSQPPSDNQTAVRQADYLVTEDNAINSALPASANEPASFVPPPSGLSAKTRPAWMSPVSAEDCTARNSETEQPTRGAKLAPQSFSATSTGSTAIGGSAENGSSGTSGAAWQAYVHQAAEELGSRVSAEPASTAEIHQHASLRILRLLAGDTEGALEPIPHLPPAEQDYWSRQLFALATYLDHHSQPDDKRRAAASVLHLDEAVSNLRELGSLTLRNVSFCKNVYGFGAYETFDRDEFAAAQQVSIYVEVENYHCESTDKGYCTILGATYELLDDSGKRVAGGDFPDVEDYCKSRRRDFHIQYGLSLPKSMVPGQYRLDMVVKDRRSDKLAHTTIPLSIRSASK